MDDFIGRWKLVHSDKNFSSFLKHIGFNWVKRMVARRCKLVLMITKTKKGYLRKAKCKFIESDEEYIIDNVKRPSFDIDGGFKSHMFQDGYLETRVFYNTIQWKETISVDDDLLYVKRDWVHRKRGTPEQTIRIFQLQKAPELMVSNENESGFIVLS